MLALWFLACLLSPAACRQAEELAGYQSDLSQLSAVIPQELAPAGCVFLDLAEMRDHYPDIYAEYKTSFGPLSDYGIELDQADRMASAGLSLFVLRGSFDLDRVREELRVRDYEPAGYLGIEVWEGGATGPSSWVAFPQGLTVAGCKDHVIECIEVMCEGKGSLGSVDDISDILSRLPAGMDVSTASLGRNDTLLAHGESLRPIDGGALQLTVVQKYVDEISAVDHAGRIASDFQEMLSNALEGIKTRQDGQFVVLDARLKPETISSTLAAGR